MIMRSVERRPAKASLAVLGIALAMAIVIVGRYVFDAIEELRRMHFDVVDRADVTVTFHTARPASAMHALYRLPGVQRVELFRAVPVRLRYAHRAERTALMGLEPASELRRIVGANGEPIEPPVAGLLLTARLAAQLGVRPGEMVMVEVLEGRRPRREMLVAGTVDELIGTGAYLSAPTLDRLLGEAPAASGAFLAADPRAAAVLYTALKRLPAVSGVGVRRAAIESFYKTIAESFRISLVTIIALATVIAAGVVYNGARVALSEHGRELASLRVLGFTRGEVAAMLLGEQALLTALALPVGALAGLGLCVLLVRRFESDLFRIPLVISPATYAFGALVVVLASALSAAAVARGLARLDLVQVLKTRE